MKEKIIETLTKTDNALPSSSYCFATVDRKAAHYIFSFHIFIFFTLNAPKLSYLSKVQELLHMVAEPSKINISRHKIKKIVGNFWSEFLTNFRLGKGLPIRINFSLLICQWTISSDNLCL